MALGIRERLKALLDDQGAGTRLSAFVVLSIIFAIWMIFGYVIATRLIAGEPPVLSSDTLGFIPVLVLTVPAFSGMFKYLRSDRAR